MSSGKNMEEQINPQPNHEPILESILEKTHDVGKEGSQQRDIQIQRQEHHKELDHNMDDYKLLLMDRANELQKQSIQKLEELIKKIGSLDKVLKTIAGESKPKSFKPVKAKEKTKLALTSEVAMALKDLKPKINRYKLLLSYLKTGK